MVKQISIRELRANLAKVMKNVCGKLDRYIISRRGAPEAILMSVEDYESILETMEIRADKGLVDSIARGEKELAAGKITRLEDLEKDLGRV